MDIERLLNANIFVSGKLTTDKRRMLIESALTQLNTNNGQYFKTKYLGIKNYSGFGDQGHDGPYGTGPKHGNIVFQIGARNRDAFKTTSDDIYYLIAFQSFNSDREESFSNLLKKYRDAKKVIEDIGNVFKEQSIITELQEYIKEA